MSTLKINNIQIGQSATAANNFSLAVPNLPNGTIKLSRGNASATLVDILNVSTSGQVDLFGGLSSTNIQIGQSATATNNFFFSTPSTGAMKLARGNNGSGTQDLMTVDATGKVDFPAGLAAFIGTNQSLTSPGYQKFPGGLILQWGYLAGTNGTFNFPIPFPTTALAVFASNANAQGSAVDNAFAYIVNASQFYIATKQSTGNYISGYPCYWFAIGM